MEFNRDKFIQSNGDQDGILKCLVNKLSIGQEKSIMQVIRIAHCSGINKTWNSLTFSTLLMGTPRSMM